MGVAGGKLWGLCVRGRTSFAPAPFAPSFPFPFALRSASRFRSMSSTYASKIDHSFAVAAYSTEAGGSVMVAIDREPKLSVCEAREMRR